MDKRRILIVDDDPAILRLLSTNLKARGYEVLTATDGEDSLETVQREYIDLMILDLMMPKVDGVEVVRRLREWSGIPVIILSARGDETAKVKCLELGADDYLTKPFGIAELMARINTAFRHKGDASAKPAQVTFNLEGMEINFAKRRVTVDSKEINLTPTEYSLLQHLALNSDKILTHSMLLQSVWGQEYSSEKEYLRVFVGRLRVNWNLTPKIPDISRQFPAWDITWPRWKPFAP
jgi:two-component system KDP operon response regulator KdpE